MNSEPTVFSDGVDEKWEKKRVRDAFKSLWWSHWKDVLYSHGEHLLCDNETRSIWPHPVYSYHAQELSQDDVHGRCTQLSLSDGFLRCCHPSPSFPAVSHSCSLFLSALPHCSLMAAGSIELDEIRHIYFILRHSWENTQEIKVVLT